MTNRSTVRTKKAIKHAFSELVEEKGLDSLTVSDVARTAGINRGTFYLHYVDKDDLKNQLESEALESLQERLFSNENADPDDPVDVIPYEAILGALEYVQDDFEFIRAIVGPRGDHAFLGRFRGQLGQMIEKQIAKSSTLRLSMKGFPREYAMQVMLSGIVAITELWLSNGGKESPEEIATMIHESRKLAPYEFLK
ncbi:MAG: TetR/AcrR family transcriptional regulator C-terminal domain-containing protein [Bifidobacteriaceae bacterium]|jgi:AcrR family transcriptional regulator|nr:TetR/AcrR family transcriptional regulator C-terminal domain-containing protein [Bifidobacteriaceae bacterium]MCI1914843.1 TetR/AcrR family transcriptional regulator C-terminal domain-containing protein [Bifidobacteriaceae bacterium]